jgi:hypothetical protein
MFCSILVQTELNSFCAPLHVPNTSKNNPLPLINRFILDPTSIFQTLNLLSLRNKWSTKQNTHIFSHKSDIFVSARYGTARVWLMHEGCARKRESSRGCSWSSQSSLILITVTHTTWNCEYRQLIFLKTAKCNAHRMRPNLSTGCYVT